MLTNYSSPYSFKTVDPTIKKKKLAELMPQEKSSGTYWGDPNAPDPSVTGTLPKNSLGRNAREILAGNGRTPQPNEETDGTGNALGIPQKNLRLAFGLSALSHAVNPSGSGKDLMRFSGGLLEESQRSGERAREIMRQEQKEIEKRRQEIADKEQERKFELEDRADERKYKSGLLSESRRFSREMQEDRQRENAPLLKARLDRLNRVAPETTKGPGPTKVNEKNILKNANAELKSLGAFIDNDEGSINFPAESELAISKALKKHGISFYPGQTPSEDGTKTFYLGAYDPEQANNTGQAFNLDDYMPKPTLDSYLPKPKGTTSQTAGGAHSFPRGNTLIR